MYVKVQYNIKICLCYIWNKSSTIEEIVCKKRAQHSHKLMISISDEKEVINENITKLLNLLTRNLFSYLWDHNYSKLILQGDEPMFVYCLHKKINCFTASYHEWIGSIILWLGVWKWALSFNKFWSEKTVHFVNKQKWDQKQYCRYCVWNKLSQYKRIFSV